MPHWHRLARSLPLLLGLLLPSIPPASATLAAIPPVAVARTPDPATVRVADLGPVAKARSAVTPSFHLRDAASYVQAKARVGQGPVLNVESAVWQNGTLWTSGHDACVPTGDNAQRACLRLFQVSTAAPPPSLLQDFDVGVVGADLYYPAVTVNGRGGAFAAFAESSSTVYASAATAAQLTTDPAGSLGAIQIVARGLGTYTCGGACGGGPMRWGDYSGASPDPTDPASAWIVGEFAASSQNGADWGTGVARVGNSGALAVTPTPTGGDPPGAGNPPPAVGTPRAYLPSISIP